MAYKPVISLSKEIPELELEESETSKSRIIEGISENYKNLFQFLKSIHSHLKQIENKIDQVSFSKAQELFNSQMRDDDIFKIKLEKIQENEPEIENAPTTVSVCENEEEMKDKSILNIEKDMLEKSEKILLKETPLFDVKFGNSFESIIQKITKFADSVCFIFGAAADSEPKKKIVFEEEDDEALALWEVSEISKLKKQEIERIIRHIKYFLKTNKLSDLEKHLLKEKIYDCFKESEGKNLCNVWDLFPSKLKDVLSDQKQKQSGGSNESLNKSMNICSSPKKKLFSKKRSKSSGNLPVFVSPFFPVPLDSVVKVFSGESYTFRCKFTGEPRPQVHWFKNGLLIIPDGKNPNFYIKIDESTGNCILEIRQVIFANEGTYTCRARNPFGSESTSTKLIVMEELKSPKLNDDEKWNSKKFYSIDT